MSWLSRFVFSLAKVSQLIACINSFYRFCVLNDIYHSRKTVIGVKCINENKNVFSFPTESSHIVDIKNTRNKLLKLQKPCKIYLKFCHYTK